MYVYTYIYIYIHNTTNNTYLSLVAHPGQPPTVSARRPLGAAALEPEPPQPISALFLTRQSCAEKYQNPGS